MSIKPDTDKLVFPLKVMQTPFCGDLRSKKFYMRDEILTSAEDYHDASGHIFCYRTQMPVGPDGMRVEPESCGPDRACYRSALSKPAPYVPGQGGDDYY